MKRLKFILVIMTVVVLCGCWQKSPPPVDRTKGLQSDIVAQKPEHAAVSKDHAAARAKLATAAKLSATQPAIHDPIMDADGNIVSAETHNKNADALADAEAKELEALRKADLASQKKASAFDAYLAKHHDDLLGPLGQRIMWGVIISVILALVIRGYVTGAFTGFPVASWGMTAFHAIFSGGTSLIHLVGQYIGAWIHKPAPAPTPAAATAAPAAK